MSALNPAANINSGSLEALQKYALVYKTHCELNQLENAYRTDRLFRVLGLETVNDLESKFEEERSRLLSAKGSLIQEIRSSTKDVGTVIGIDLGTTYSCVAIFKNGGVEIIADDQGNRITPSYVAFTSDDERLIGDAAKNQLTSNPQNTVFGVKRLIGREFHDPSVQQHIKHFPFKVIEKNSKPIIQIDTGKGQKLFTPEEISAMILGKMRDIAEAYLGKKVTHAVVTVPGYFNNAQRQATKDAGTISGLNVIRIINEPTAAAIAYGFDEKKKDIKDEEQYEKNILVFYLGGGTFDVSLLNISYGVLKVVAKNGYPCLGGEAFDQRVMEHFIELFKTKTGKDVRKDDRAVQKLRQEVEKAKQTLSSEYDAKLEIKSFFDNEDFNETLTRAKFEDLNKDLFRLTITTIEKLINEVNCPKCSIDKIVLVGGSTRIPIVQKLVKEFFNGKEPLCRINPDEAVAYDAALQTSVLLSEKDVDDVVFFDVNSLSIGFAEFAGVMARIIPRNTIIPTKKSHTFSTLADDQPSVAIQAFEGDHIMTRDNHYLGKLVLTGIPPAPRGVPQIEVTFEIDVNGIVRITAEDKGTGNKNYILINSYTNRLSPKEIDRLIKDSKKISDEDEKVREQVYAKNDLESYVYSLKMQLNDKQKFVGKLSSDNEKTIKTVIEEKIKWLESNEDAEVDELKEYKKQLEEIVTPIINKLYAQGDGPGGVSDSSPPPHGHDDDSLF